MLNTDTISGEIISLDDDGSGKISISMNNQSIEKNYTWVMDKETEELFYKNIYRRVRMGSAKCA